MNDDTEVRLRCLEAAARNPFPHSGGMAVGVLEAAQKWSEWVLGQPPAAQAGAKGPLGLPKKLV